MDFDDLRYICRETEDRGFVAQSEDDEPGLEMADPAPPAAFSAVMYEEWFASTSRDWRPRGSGRTFSPGPVKMGVVFCGEAQPKPMARSRAEDASFMERVSQECELLSHLFETSHQTLALDPTCDTHELVATATRIVRGLADVCGSSVRSGDSLVEFHLQLLDAIDSLGLPQVVLERIKHRLTPADVREGLE
jgi:hypothetical protein